ncbi:MAG TPA: zinc-dependent metalloprotease family protein, partial [Chitinophagaceae bacterium]|nr:zinc-dependent metalloprotease family protein [Chitinophagaceae bacterium]
MKSMCRIFLVLMIAFVVSHDLLAQNYFFAEARENEISATSAGKRVIIPEKYKSLVLDVRGMQDFLKKLPPEKVTGGTREQIIELPLPQGGRAAYRIWESPVMEPGLAVRFPGIKTYSGQGIDDPTATIKVDFTELGFHAMVLSDLNDDIFIDPYRQSDIRNYQVYYKKDFKKKNPFSEIGVIEPSEKKVSANKPMAGPCIGTELHTYRLAVACTGEYAIEAVGVSNPTVAQALSAIVTSVNRVDGIYEREVAISLNLVSNNNLVVFVNPSTDPFTANDDGSALLDESQTVIST